MARDSRVVLVVPRHGDPTLLVQLYNHVPNARRVARTGDVRWSGTWLPETLLSVLEAVPIHEGIVRLVGSWPARIVDGLRIVLAQIGLVDASHILRGLRTIKSTEELDRLRIAARLIDAAMRALEERSGPTSGSTSSRRSWKARICERVARTRSTSWPRRR